MEKVEQYLREYRDNKPLYIGNDTIAFISTRSGYAEIWEMDLNTGVMVQRTFLNSTVYSLAASIKYGIYLFTIDENGSENEQLFVLPFSSKEPVRLTNDLKHMHLIAGLAKGGKELIYLVNNESTRYDICAVDIETKVVRLIGKTPRPNAYPISMSPDGTKMVYHVHAGYADGPNYMIDVFTGEQKRIAPDDAVSCEYCGAWTPDGKKLYTITDRDYNFRRVVSCDMTSDSIEFAPVFSTEAECEYVSVSSDGKILAVLMFHRGYSEMVMISTETNEKLCDVSLPKSGHITMSIERANMCWIDGTHKLLISLAQGAKAARIFLVNADDGSATQITTGSLLGEDDTVSEELRTFKSYDGLEIPYWLFVPRGMKAENLPVLIEIHGGPEAQYACKYDGYVQYMVSKGIAVVAPNVRGSAGYGKIYCHLDDVEKRLDSVKDIKSLVDHLVSEGIADKNKLIVSGTSYGGFMTLSCVARMPKLWACAVDIVGIFNLRSFLQRTSDYRRATRETEYGTLKDNWDMLYEVSPAAKADDMVTPMIVVHGANDPRVPISETEELVESLKARGVEVEYLRYEDEGHGLSKVANRIDGYQKIADFILRHVK